MLLFILTLVFLYPVIFGGKALLSAKYLAGIEPWNGGAPPGKLPQWNPLQWDGIAQFYPWRVHYSRSLSDGYLPLWNPHQFCGTPFAANAQTAVLYPLNLLFVIFTPVKAFGFSAALHLFLAGAFAFLLARALGLGRFGATVSGIVFEFSAFMVVWLELPTLVNVAVWLPLVLYLILRSMDRTGPIHAVFAGCALSMSILAGHFQVASYIVAAVALWWIWLIAGRFRIDGRAAIWRGAGLALLSFFVTFLITAPQVLPTLELAGLSHRVREATLAGYATYVSNAVPARNLITLFLPNFYGNPSIGNYWAGSAADFIEYALYIGLLPLFLAVVGSAFTIRWRGSAYFLVLAVISLLFVLGTPVNYLAYFLTPGTSALGGPNRMIVLFCFSAAMLAGYGAHWFIQFAREEYMATHRKHGWRAISIALAQVVSIFIAVQLIATDSLKALGVDTGQVMGIAFSQYLSLASVFIAGLVVLALYTAGQLSKPMFAGLVLAVIVSDLFSFGMGFNQTVPRKEVYPETQLTRWLSDNVNDTRLMPVNRSWSISENPAALLPPNSATVYGFYDMQGYDSLFPRRYKEFVDRNIGMDSSPQENGNMLFIRQYVTSWPEGTAGYVLSRSPMAGPGLSEAADLDGVHVYKEHTHGEYQPAYLLLPADPTIGTTGEKPKGRAWITERDSPNEVEVLAETDQPARLVLAEAWYPGWRALVDGRERPVEVAQSVFRSVLIEPGKHLVEFRYQPGGFVVGIFFGLLGITAVGTALGAAIAGRRG
ncbi:MAG: YfhO family protein [Armatimonadota bacterium]